MVPFEAFSIERPSPPAPSAADATAAPSATGAARGLVLCDRDARAHRQRGTKQDGSPVHEYPPCPARIRVAPIVALAATLATRRPRRQLRAVPAGPGIVPSWRAEERAVPGDMPRDLRGAGHARRGHRPRAAAGTDRLRAAARAARGVPGLLRGVRAVRYPPGAVFRADRDRAQSRADAEPGRGRARDQADQFRRHARRAGKARRSPSGGRPRATSAPMRSTSRRTARR